MEFSIGIHSFLTRVILEDVKISSERYCFSELEKKQKKKKTFVWKYWHCTKIFLNMKKKYF